MSRSRTGRYLLALALLLGLALRVPGWFTQDVKDDWQTFEPDEGQHVHAATHRLNDLWSGPPVGDYRSAPWNVRGYGHLMAYAAWGWYTVVGRPPSFRDLLMLGRQFSTAFALLLIGVVYAAGRAAGLDPPGAGTAALLLAGCDAHATISHYALPAAGYVFWCYLAVLGALRLARRPPGLTALAWLAVGAGGALAFKFDVLPLAWGGLYLLWLTLAERRLPGWYVPLGVAGVVATVAAFWWGWPPESIGKTFATLRELNAGGVPLDDHWVDNLIVYPAGVLAGVGLPVFALAAYGLYRLLVGADAGAGGGGKAEVAGRTALLVYLVGWLLSEFAVRWSVDTAFIRRVNVFMPAVCLLAAYALVRLRRRRWLPPAVVAYTLAFAVVGQSNHWFDTRYAMRDYVNHELPADARVEISGYVSLQGLRKTRFYGHGEWDYLVLHETYYSRYWKSMTTPFGLPECCAGVYNCRGEDECRYFQALLGGQAPGVRLRRAFRPLRLFPERIAYAHWFGNYETFLGSTLVFERTGER